jgi:hypothetical protein
MIMGQYAASNILNLLSWLEEQTEIPTTPSDGPSTNKFLQCPDFKPMMALSVGDEAVAYTKASGVAWGKDIKEKIIGRGLGIDSKSIIETTDKAFADPCRMFQIPQVR